MRRFLLLFFVATAVCAPAQKFIPKTIQFHGDPDYTDQELMSAAGLKKGEMLDYAGMNERSKELLASGMFATLAFKFDGQDLIFTLTPSDNLVAAHFQNLPPIAGGDADAYLRKQLPLYRGKVPTEEGLMESVRAALEKMLAGEGITATVTTTTGADVASRKVNAVFYSITSPAVAIGNVQLNGVSDSLRANAEKALEEVVKEPFDAANSAANLQRAVEQMYHDQGYAAVKVQVSTAGAPAVTAGSIAVPYAIDVTEGRVYKTVAVKLPDGAPLSQEDANRFLADRPGAPPQGMRIRFLLDALSRQYKANGYMDCTLTPNPQFDDNAATVSYTIDADPGPVYHLGFVKFDNVSDQMRSLLMHYWQMMPGDVFNEAYVSQFLIKAEQQDATLARSLTGVKETFDATADQQGHTVNVVIRLSR